MCSVKPYDIWKLKNALVMSPSTQLCSPAETCPRSAIEMHNWEALQTAPYLVWLKAQSGARLYSHVAWRDECQVTRNLAERDKRMDISVGQVAVRKLWLLKC